MTIDYIGVSHIPSILVMISTIWYSITIWTVMNNSNILITDNIDSYMKGYGHFDRLNGKFYTINVILICNMV